MVREVGEWSWSSYRATVGLQEAPDWLDVPAVLSLFNDSLATARTAYRGFVADGVNQPSPWTHLTRIIHDASATSADTRLRRAVSPFSPSTYCTSMPQSFTPPSACLASRLHAFATNLHE